MNSGALCKSSVANRSIIDFPSMNQRFLLPFIFVLAALKAGAAATPDPGPASLKSFIETIRQASVSGNTEKLVRLARGTFPGRESLKKALSDHVPTATIDKLDQWFREAATSPDAEFAKTFGITEAESIISVHAATAQDLILNTRESAAYQHFPQGIHPFAHDGTLRDDTTYYMVTVSEPGNVKKIARRIDLMFWDGEAWKILGAIWNVLTAEDPLPDPPLNESVEVQKNHLQQLENRLVEYQAMKQKAEAELASAMAEIKNATANEEQLKATMDLALEASKRVLAMQTKIPRLEERIKSRKLKITLMDLDLGFSPEMLQKVRDQIRAKPASPRLKLDTEKKELSHLKNSKKAIARGLENPATLSKEDLVRLVGKMTEVDKLIEAKEATIEKMEQALTPAPPAKD